LRLTLTYEELLSAALDARKRAHAPYSNYRVGAALLAEDGCVFSGCNVESSSYGLTICAERVALFKAVSEGAGRFVALALTAGPGKPCHPCGACRQVLWEHAPGLVIIAEDEKGKIVERKLKALLPDPFDHRCLEGS